MLDSYRSVPNAALFGPSVSITLFIIHHDYCIGYPADNYMFKVNNRNTRTRYEICSKLTIKTPEGRHWNTPLLRKYIWPFYNIMH